MGNPASLDLSPYGVNLHVASHYVPTFAQIGVRWCRVDIDWDTIEPRRGEYDWRAVDAVIESADANGMSVLGSIAYTPAWASDSRRYGTLSPEERRAAPPIANDLFVEFVHGVLGRYQNTLHAAGIWNEPDLKTRQFWRGSLDQYVDLLTAALKAVRDTAPDVVRCGPDLSGWTTRSWRDWVSPSEQRVWLGRIIETTERCDPRGPLLDVITHHQYGGGDTPAGRFAAIDDLLSFLSRRLTSSRPLWITETGWATDKEPSFERQAQHLETTLRGMLARQAWQKTFWYDSHGAQGAGVEWGLFGPDGARDEGRPRPTFFAYGKFIANNGGTIPTPKAEASRRVELAYQAILGRPADADGLAAFIQVLQRRSTREVCDALLSSPEFAERRRLVDVDEIVSQFFNAIPASVPADEIASARATLEQGQAAPMIAHLIERSAQSGA